MCFYHPFLALRISVFLNITRENDCLPSFQIREREKTNCTLPAAEPELVQVPMVSCPKARIRFCCLYTCYWVRSNEDVLSLLHASDVLCDL